MESYATREQWLAARSSGLGASESQVALGLSPWQSPYYLWAVKSGRIPPDDLSGVEAVEWGLRLEREIGNAFSDRSGRQVQYDDDLTIRRHSRLPWLTCTLDAIQYDDNRDSPGVLQIKTASAYKAKEWKDEPPLYYRVQVMHEMAVTGFTWGSLVVLIGGQRLVGPFDMDFDHEAWSMIEPRLERFWQCVATGEPPEVDWSESTTNALAKLHPDDNGEAIDLGDDIESLADQRDEIGQQIKELSDRRRGIENEIKAALGDNTYGILPSGGKLTYKTIERDGYEVKPAKYRTLRRSKK